MSTLYDRPVRCAICGRETDCTEIGTTNAFGSPDLDLRPPEMQRSTLPFWIQKCSFCGYTATDLSKTEETDPAYLSSPEYTRCEDLPLPEGRCRHFYQYYLLGRQRGDREAQLFGLRCAFWICDDLDELWMAEVLRGKAIQLLDEHPEEDPEQREREMVMRADLLRRSGQFQRLLDEYRGFEAKAPIHRAILRYELRCARMEDDRAHTVREAAPRFD